MNMINTRRRNANWEKVAVASSKARLFVSQAVSISKVEEHIMRKYLIILSLLGLLFGIPAFAQSGDACNIEAPAEPVELQLISWPFAITEFYAAEMEACSEVDNLTINVNLIDSTSLQEQVRLALSTGGDSPYDIVHGANGQVSEWGAPGWVMPLNDLVDKYRDQYNLDDIPQSAWGRRHAGRQYPRGARRWQYAAPGLPRRCL